jgi:hypothetical protein
LYADPETLTERRTKAMEKQKRDFLEAIQLIQKIFRKIREKELDLVANQSKCMCNANNINNLTNKEQE